MASTEGTTAQAQEKAQEVAGQAKEQAQQVAGEAKSRLRTQVGTRSTQAGEQINAQAGDIRSVAGQLRRQGKDRPAQLVEQAADRAEGLGSYLKDADADRILDDVEDFARQRPWAVIAGGIALGFAASRFLKASSSARYDARPQQLPNTPTRPAGVTPAPAPDGAGTGSRAGDELSGGVRAGAHTRPAEVAGTGIPTDPVTERVDPVGPAGTPDPASTLGTPAGPGTRGF